MKEGEEFNPADFTNRWFMIIGAVVLFILAVTQTPIASWLSGVQASVTTSVGTYFQVNSMAENLDSALVGHWTFDGPNINWSDTGTEIKDRTSQANHGSVASVMGPNNSTVSGVIGQALSLKRDDDYVSLGKKYVIAGESAATVCVWVWQDELTFDQKSVVGNMRANEDDGWVLKLDGSRIDFRYDSSVRRLESDFGVLSPNEWSHICGVFSGSEYVAIYYNGDQISYDSTSIPPTLGLDTSNATHLWFGAKKNVFVDDGFTDNFTGYIDDVRLYNKALTAEEINYVYNQNATTLINTTQSSGSLDDGLVGHWTFDGPDIRWQDTGSEIKDRSEQDNHGDAINLTPQSASAGVMGQGISFDGISDNVLVTNADGYNLVPGFSNNFSISGWFKTAYSDVTIFAFSDSQGGEMTLNVTGQLVYTQGSELSVTSPDSYNDGDWHHFTMVKNGNYTGDLYVDGNLVDQDTTSSQIRPISPVTSDLYLGQDIDGSNKFEGNLDDIRIYERELSANEVSLLYQLGGGVTVTPCGAKTVTDADGNEYGTVQIGSQCWMAENLRVGTTINGSTNQTDNGTIERWCYNNDDDICDTTGNPNNPDGGLYQWDEAMQYSTEEGAQGICPAGWHIPTDDEWKNLEVFLGLPIDEVNDTGVRGTNQGQKLKTGGSSRFEGNLAGFGDANNFDFRNVFGSWWSSSESSSINSWTRAVLSSSDQVNRDEAMKTLGFQVRCIETGTDSGVVYPEEALEPS